MGLSLLTHFLLFRDFVLYCRTSMYLYGTLLYNHSVLEFHHHLTLPAAILIQQQGDAAVEDWHLKRDTTDHCRGLVPKKGGHGILRG